MRTPTDFWTDQAKRFLKAELKRAGVTYAVLAKNLTLMGLPETEGSITVKINRGRFSVPFLFATLNAIGRELRVEDGKRRAPVIADPVIHHLRKRERRARIEPKGHTDD